MSGSRIKRNEEIKRYEIFHSGHFSSQANIDKDITLMIAQMSDMKDQILKLQERNERLEHGNLRLMKDRDEAVKHLRYMIDGYQVSNLRDAQDYLISIPKGTKPPKSVIRREAIQRGESMPDLSKNKEES